MSILILLSAVTAPVSVPVLAPVAPAPVALPAPMVDLSAPPSPHAPMRIAPAIGMSPEEALAAVRPVNRSSRPRWRVYF